MSYSNYSIHFNDPISKESFDFYLKEAINFKINDSFQILDTINNLVHHRYKPDYYSLIKILGNDRVLHQNPSIKYCFQYLECGKFNFLRDMAVIKK